MGLQAPDAARDAGADHFREPARHRQLLRPAAGLRSDRSPSRLQPRPRRARHVTLFSCCNNSTLGKIATRQRRTDRVRALLLVCFLGVLSHPILDFMNTYGVRLLDPLSQRWFYGDTLFIIDPWIWIALILGLEMSWRAERLGRNWTPPLRGRWARCSATLRSTPRSASAPRRLPGPGRARGGAADDRRRRSAAPILAPADDLARRHDRRQRHLRSASRASTMSG